MPIRVVVADDSTISRVLLREALERDSDIVVVGEATDAESTLEVVRSARPDIATIDMFMPGGGLLAIELVMSRSPVPILVVTSAGGDREGPKLAFEAVRRGALDLVAKPRGSRSDEAEALRAVVRSLARVPVVRHVTGERAARGSPTANAAVPTASRGGPPAQRARLARPLRVVGVVSSAGGPGAVAALVGALPSDFPATVAIVQHVGAGFAEPFARFVEAHTSLRVVVATGRVGLDPGTVVVAGEEAHLVAPDGDSLTMEVGPPKDGHRPSGNRLLGSLAAAHGPRAAGVVLSGIGSDGTDGLGALRIVGGRTFAQSEASAAVYGMPRAAMESGAVDCAMAPEEIAAALVEGARAR